jgi:hypothetical protein
VPDRERATLVSIIWREVAAVHGEVVGSLTVMAHTTIGRHDHRGVPVGSRS